MAVLDEHPAVPVEDLVTWAGRAVEKSSQFAWYGHTQAMAAYRAGDQEGSRKSLEASKKLGWSAGGQALNELASAMIELRQGRGVLAMQHYGRARAVLERVPTAHVVQSDLTLTDWLEFQVLRSKIEGPLEDAVFPADPFAAPGDRQLQTSAS